MTARSGGMTARNGNIENANIISNNNDNRYDNTDDYINDKINNRNNDDNNDSAARYYQVTKYCKTPPPQVPKGTAGYRQVPPGIAKYRQYSQVPSWWNSATSLQLFNWLQNA